MFENYIREFISSEQMQEHLIHTDRYTDNIADIIYFSPTSIDKKYKALCKLKPEIEGIEDEYLNKDCDEFIKVIELAKELKLSEGIFTLEADRYNESDKCCEEEFAGVYATFDHAIEYIRDDMDINEVSSPQLWWYKLTKWIACEDGRMIEACTYIVVRGEVWFVTLNSHIYDVQASDAALYELNISVPFKAGDIVEIDGYPFTPKKKILITSVGDNLDCCCLQSLYSDEAGKWNVAALKHGWFGFDQFLKISPLYSMKKYQGELSGDDVIFRAVSMYINGDEAKGEEIGYGIGRARNLDAQDVYHIIFG